MYSKISEYPTCHTAINCYNSLVKNKPLTALEGRRNLSFHPPSYLEAQFCDFRLERKGHSPVVVSHRLGAHKAPSLDYKTGKVLRSTEYKV